MKVNRSVEHAVLAILMIAVQAGGEPVKSHVLSGVMGVSDSYLKKTMRKLVAAGVVRSSASKGGGFSLARPIDGITLGDVYRAVEPGGFSFRSSPLAEAVFPDDAAHVAQGAARVAAAFEGGYAAFLETLDACPLSALLEDEATRGEIDWGSRRGARRPA